MSLKFYIYDYFVEQPSESNHRYWSVGGEGHILPDYIKNLYSEIKRTFNIIDPNGWSDMDYLGGVKVDVSLAKCCVFRLYSGGRGSDDRPNRWVMLVLEMDLVPLDILKYLEMDCFKSYRVESAIAAPLPEKLPRIVGEESLLAPLKLPESCGVTAERLRGFSLSMTSGRGVDRLLLVERSKNDYRGYLRPCLAKRKVKKEAQPATPGSTPTTNHSPPITKARNRKLFASIVRNRLNQISIIFLTGSLLGFYAGRKQAKSAPPPLAAPSVITGPKPGSIVTFRVSGNGNYSIMPGHNKSRDFVEFEIHRGKLRTKPPIDTMKEESAPVEEP